MPHTHTLHGVYARAGRLLARAPVQVVLLRLCSLFRSLPLCSCQLSTTRCVKRSSFSPQTASALLDDSRLSVVVTCFLNHLLRLLHHYCFTLRQWHPIFVRKDSKKFAARETVLWAPLFAIGRDNNAIHSLNASLQRINVQNISLYTC